MNTTTWVLDPTHSELNFKIRHLMISNVKGSFRKFDASIQGEDFTKANITATIQTATVDTNNEDRDKHLQSEDFFHAAQYPEIRFESNEVKKKSDDDYTLTGELTMHGVSKKVVLDVTYGGSMKDPWGNEKAGFSVSGKINRKDWGLGWNAALEAGGVMVGEEVLINAELQFVKKS